MHTQTAQRAIATSRHPLPDGHHLRSRAARGADLAVIEVVRRAATDELARVEAVQRAAEARGEFGPHTLAVVVLRARSRRVAAHVLARRMASGRPSPLHEPHQVWEPHRVRDGRLGPIHGQWDQFDQALRAVL